MAAAEISAPSDLLVISLGAFGNKHAALYCALRDWLDRPIGWRIIPGARLLSAFEGDHNNALWRLAIEALGLAATYHKVVMAIEKVPAFPVPSPYCFMAARSVIASASEMMYAGGVLSCWP